MGDFNLLGLDTVLLAQGVSAARQLQPAPKDGGHGRMLCTQQLETFQGHCMTLPLGDVAAGRVITR